MGNLKLRLFAVISLVALVIGSVSLQAKALEFDSDITPDLKDQMLNDLSFMNQIQGNGKSTAAHAKIFGKVDGKDYQNFFESRVASVGLNDCGDPKAVACVIPFMDASKMWITQNYIKFSHPQIARLMVIYHESRHTESQNGNWPHATCPSPFVNAQGQEIVSIWTGSNLENEPACDDTIYGSYGSSTILLHNISLNCTNCTEKVKADAKLYSDDQANRLIGDAPADLAKDYATLN